MPLCGYIELNIYIYIYRCAPGCVGRSSLSHQPVTLVHPPTWYIAKGRRGPFRWPIWSCWELNTGPVGQRVLIREPPLAATPAFWHLNDRPMSVTFGIDACRVCFLFGIPIAFHTFQDQLWCSPGRNRYIFHWTTMGFFGMEGLGWFDTVPHVICPHG